MRSREPQLEKRSEPGLHQHQLLQGAHGAFRSGDRIAVRAFCQGCGQFANLLGNAGRNSIVGPGLFNADLSLSKNVAVPKISESFKVQFRAEFFNVLNHPNFGPPLAFQGAHSAVLFGADGLPSGTGFLANPTVTKPREGQFALKVIW